MTDYLRYSYQIHSQILVDVGSWTQEQKNEYDRRYAAYIGENTRAWNKVDERMEARAQARKQERPWYKRLSS